MGGLCVCLFVLRAGKYTECVEQVVLPFCTVSLLSVFTFMPTHSFLCKKQHIDWRV